MKRKTSRFTPKRPAWIRNANHPDCTCHNGSCLYHNYPYRGTLVEHPTQTYLDEDGRDPVAEGRVW